MKSNHLIFILLLLGMHSVFAQSSFILPMKDRAAITDKILEERMQTILPGLMERTGIDMWVVISREYNEDPVIKTMLPATWLSARRRTVLIMVKKEDKVEGFAVARYDVGSAFKKAWDKEKQPDQWKRVAEIVEAHQPKKIGINKSNDFGLADGIVSTDYEAFMAAIGKYSKRVVHATPLAVGWLETRSATEMMVYPQICRIAHEIIAEAFSNKVIQPGVTTTEDVVWWMRERVRELKLVAWFHPTVSIQRFDPESFDHLRSFSKRPDKNVILPGDLLHVDFGITYLRLNTDTQQHAYVLKPGETEVPAYLKDAFKTGNQLQDIFTGNFALGKTGNEVLKESREEAISKGLQPTIYTHPIGFHGHAAGPTLGMWDAQGGVPGSGDYPLYYNTAYSIELNNAVFLQEWNKEIRIMLEEEAFFDANGVRYIDGRQTDIIVIGN